MKQCYRTLAQRDWGRRKGSGVGTMIFKEQAESCRKQASEFVGRPEAPFLLRVASAFDELALDDTATHLHAENRSVQIIRPTLPS